MRRLAIGSVLLVLAGASIALGQTERESAAAELPSRIPIFPLQDVMLFPGVPRPLHIFEPRYREMLEDALEGDRVIGMVMLEPGHEDEYFGRPPVFAMGCAGVLGPVEELPDGRYNIVLYGTTKFRVTGEDDSRSYRLADVEVVPELMDEAKREALAELRPSLARMFAELTNGEAPSREELDDEALANGLAQYLELEPLERLELLKKPDPLARAQALIDIDRRKRSVARRR